MNYQEYIKELVDIELQLDKGVIDDDIEEKIEDLYNYKPVSMQWHVVKCKEMMKKERYVEVLQKYGDFITKCWDYKENIILWQQLILAYEKTGQILEGARQSYMLSKLTKNAKYEQLEFELNVLKEKFVAGNNEKETLLDLEELYYKTSNRLLAYLVYLYMVNQYPDAKDSKKDIFYTNVDNMGYFAEYVTKKKTIIIVTDSKGSIEYDIASYILHSLDVPVYMISDCIEVEGEFDLQASVQVSIDNAQHFEDCIAIRSVARVDESGKVENNIPYIINFLCKTVTEDDFAITIAENKMQEELRSHAAISKRYERLSCYEAEYLEDEVGFGRAGDYLTYLSLLYQTDVRELLDREPECDFSIVIPVRNSSKTLYHTLQTCLEQDYIGTYEVVLSDNSIPGNTEVYELFCKMSDERIKYYKTPKNLGLAKSFEYAYLQTRGEVVLSIGADDGMLPWGLRILKQVWDNVACQSRDILCWERGFYAWPGFNGGEENRFVIPRRYEKNKIHVHSNNFKEYLSAMWYTPSLMYVLPNLYINSAYKRRYLKKLYDQAGSMLDGISQDVYTGIQNAVANKEFLKIQYPITIAGMSSSSVGYLSGKASRATEISEKIKFNRQFFGEKGCGVYVQGPEIYKYPAMLTDVGILYCIMERLKRKNNLIIEINNDEESRKQTLRNCFATISVLDDKYCRYVEEGYEIAKTQSESFVTWYEREILLQTKQLMYVNQEEKENIIQRKRYNEGYTDENGIILDASRYGVENIYDAVQLFKSFLNF